MVNPRDPAEERRRGRRCLTWSYFSTFKPQTYKYTSSTITLSLTLFSNTGSTHLTPQMSVLCAVAKTTTWQLTVAKPGQTLSAWPSKGAVNTGGHKLNFTQHNDSNIASWLRPVLGCHLYVSVGGQILKDIQHSATEEQTHWSFCCSQGWGFGGKLGGRGAQTDISKLENYFFSLNESQKYFYLVKVKSPPWNVLPKTVSVLSRH